METMLQLLLFVGITVLVIFLIKKFTKLKFTCPECGHKQTKSIILKEEIKSDLIHGRRTLSGRLDKRYNSKFDSYKIVTHGIDCECCGHNYTFVHNPKSIERKIKEKIIDNDPVIKSLNSDLKKINDQASDYMEKLKERNPELYKWTKDNIK